MIQATAPEVVLSGGDAELNCNVSGNPKPSVSWSRQGVAIPASDPKYLVLPSGRLRIAGVIPSDSGTYICLASNPLGTARQSSVLFVQGTLTREKEFTNCSPLRRSRKETAPHHLLPSVGLTVAWRERLSLLSYLRKRNVNSSQLCDHFPSRTNYNEENETMKEQLLP